MKISSIMKRLLFLIAFCLSLSTIYAQTIDVVHLKTASMHEEQSPTVPKAKSSCKPKMAGH